MLCNVRGEIIVRPTDEYEIISVLTHTEELPDNNFITKIPFGSNGYLPFRITQNKGSTSIHINGKLNNFFNQNYLIEKFRVLDQFGVMCASLDINIDYDYYYICKEKEWKIYHTDLKSQNIEYQRKKCIDKGA